MNSIVLGTMQMLKKTMMVKMREKEILDKGKCSMKQMPSIEDVVTKGIFPETEDQPQF